MKSMDLKKSKPEPIYTREKPKNTSTVASARLDETTVERVFNKSCSKIKNVDFLISKTIELKTT